MTKLNQYFSNISSFSVLFDLFADGFNGYLSINGRYHNNKTGACVSDYPTTDMMEQQQQQQQQPMVVRCLEQELRDDYGFDIFHPFHPSWYNTMIQNDPNEHVCRV
jgi:hypothetical protein